jgi:hypothetical protein
MVLTLPIMLGTLPSAPTQWARLVPDPTEQTAARLLGWVHCLATPMGTSGALPNIMNGALDHSLVHKCVMPYAS